MKWGSGSMNMSADHLVLSLQHRSIAWSAAFAAALRRCARTGGFWSSRSTACRARCSHKDWRPGRMPAVKRILEQGGHRMDPMSVSLPTSTPAFQMATFYGVRPDIPGFHYYSRERQDDIFFPRSGHAAWVETRQAGGRRGILRRRQRLRMLLHRRRRQQSLHLREPDQAERPRCAQRAVAVRRRHLGGGKERGAHRRRAREGGAATHRPSQAGGARVALAEAEDLHVDLGAQLLHHGGGARSLRRRAGDLRELPRLRRDGASVGPRSDRAMQALRDVDQSIEQLWTVLRRVPEHRYDAYILADHGQSGCRPFSELTHGKRLERWIFDAFLNPERAGEPAAARAGLWRGLRERQAETRG